MSTRLQTTALISDDMQQQMVDECATIKLLKRGVWLYFFLLILEGALRKWFLPGLANPLLIVRDPVALVLIGISIHRKILVLNPYLLSAFFITLIGFYTALLFGHGSVGVALYGARIFLIHFPVMFIIGTVFTRSDVQKVGNVVLFMAIPMAILIALQFTSPQNAWVNLGVGGDEAGAGFPGALGYYRPSGTFSFTDGNTLFFAFVACFVGYFWLNQKECNLPVLCLASLSLMIAIPLAISRSLLFHTGVSLIFASLTVLGNHKTFAKLLKFAFVGFILLLVLASTPIFQIGIEVFSHRFDSANRIEGGMEGVLLDRYFGGMIKALFGSADTPFWGHGMGMGTNVGSMLLSGERKFLISEGEWGRLIGEMGPILGILLIILRLSFSFNVANKGFVKMLKGDTLPWMLLSFGLLVIPQSQWAKPTVLGFSTLIGGLILASFNEPQKKSNK
ncbi:hypothetical protein RCC89_08845 [Cytophagaceae bacterium ABcell3]|nr:hypothetical protein RCC89_08845 [Cytophagaceae bacterium ABcell3]